MTENGASQVNETFTSTPHGVPALPKSLSWVLEPRGPRLADKDSRSDRGRHPAQIKPSQIKLKIDTSTVSVALIKYK